jgi:hypothetical protein
MPLNGLRPDFLRERQVFKPIALQIGFHWPVEVDLLSIGFLHCV